MLFDLASRNGKLVTNKYLVHVDIFCPGNGPNDGVVQCVFPREINRSVVFFSADSVGFLEPARIKAIIKKEKNVRWLVSGRINNKPGAWVLSDFFGQL